MSPTGTPTLGPAKNADITTSIPLAFAGAPLTSNVKYDATIPRIENMKSCPACVFHEFFPAAVNLKLFDLDARNVKINITDSILNISRNGVHIDSPFVDLLKNETVMLKSPKIRRYAIS